MLFLPIDKVEGFYSSSSTPKITSPPAGVNQITESVFIEKKSMQANVSTRQALCFVQATQPKELAWLPSLLLSAGQTEEPRES